MNYIKKFIESVAQNYNLSSDNPKVLVLAERELYNYTEQALKLSEKGQKFFNEIQSHIEENKKLEPEARKILNKVVESAYKMDKPFKEIVAQLEKEGNPDLAKAVQESATGLSMKYWLMQFLAPLSRKELKSVVDGFMLHHVTDDMAYNLIKFLIKRFPAYYYDELGNPKVNF